MEEASLKVLTLIPGGENLPRKIATWRVSNQLQGKILEILGDTLQSQRYFMGLPTL